MHREYPSYPEEAFLASGRPVFNQQKLARDIKRCRDKKFVRGFVGINGLEENPNGPMIIWKRPVAGEAYAIGADVAEGLEDGDYSAASVINKNLEQVAVYKGHIDPDSFGRLLVNLAKYYGNAILGPEINQHGHATLAAIKNAGYYKLFKREVQEELGKDIQDKVGWHTNLKTKWKMLDDLKALFRDDSLIINHEETLREMMTLTIEDDGDVVLNSKDLTVALAISIQTLKQATSIGQNKAFVPGVGTVHDVTKLSLEDKLKHYKRIGR
jgi:hypothetical protein